MSSSLQTLLELRRDAERAARVHLERAIAARVKEEAAQGRLVEAWRAARAALLRSRGQPRPLRETLALAQARARYQERLASAVTRAAAQRDALRASALARASRAEDEARARFAAAHVALAAALKLHERQAAAAAARAERRAEDVASDHAAFAYIKNRSHP